MIKKTTPQATRALAATSNSRLIHARGKSASPNMPRCRVRWQANALNPCPPPRADMCSAKANVRYGPIADMASLPVMASLLRHVEVRTDLHGQPTCDSWPDRRHWASVPRRVVSRRRLRKSRATCLRQHRCSDLRKPALVQQTSALRTDYVVRIIAIAATL